MGFMSWEQFHCDLDCGRCKPDAETADEALAEGNQCSCISQGLYVGIAAAMRRGGYADAGYKVVSVDDCWQRPM